MNVATTGNLARTEGAHRMFLLARLAGRMEGDRMVDILSIQMESAAHIPESDLKEIGRLIDLGNRQMARPA